MNYCGFNIEPFCSDVCGDHRRPQTLAEICRNMGIFCGFRAVAAREKYSGFILLLRQLPLRRINFWPKFSQNTSRTTFTISSYWVLETSQTSIAGWTTYHFRCSVTPFICRPILPDKPSSEMLMTPFTDIMMHRGFQLKNISPFLKTD